MSLHWLFLASIFLCLFISSFFSLYFLTIYVIVCCMQSWVTRVPVNDTLHQVHQLATTTWSCLKILLSRIYYVFFFSFVNVVTLLYYIKTNVFISFTRCFSMRSRWLNKLDRENGRAYQPVLGNSGICGEKLSSSLSSCVQKTAWERVTVNRALHSCTTRSWVRNIAYQTQREEFVNVRGTYGYILTGRRRAALQKQIAWPIKQYRFKKV